MMSAIRQNRDIRMLNKTNCAECMAMIDRFDSYLYGNLRYCVDCYDRKVTNQDEKVASPGNLGIVK